MKTTIDNLSDYDLVDLCLDGNTMGYTVLYNRYSKSVLNSIYRLLGDVQESEDLLQEVFVQVFTDIGKMKKIQSFSGWINRMAINKSISRLRRNKVYFSEIEESMVPDDSAEEINLKRVLECKITDLKMAIASLPMEAKTIANLFLFEDMPQEEIAKLLGLSHNAVRGQYHRAKKKIILTLKDKVYDE